MRLNTNCPACNFFFALELAPPADAGAMTQGAGVFPHMQPEHAAALQQALGDEGCSELTAALDAKFAPRFDELLNEVARETEAFVAARLAAAAAPFVVCETCQQPSVCLEAQACATQSSSADAGGGAPQ